MSAARERNEVVVHDGQVYYYDPGDERYPWGLLSGPQDWYPPETVPVEVPEVRAELARLQRIVDSVAAVIADSEEAGREVEHPHGPNDCDWAASHDCHETARYFLRHLVQCALEGNDSILSAREAATS